VAVIFVLLSLALKVTVVRISCGKSGGKPGATGSAFFAVFVGKGLDEFDQLHRHDFPVFPCVVEVLAFGGTHADERPPSRKSILATGEVKPSCPTSASTLGIGPGPPYQLYWCVKNTGNN